MANIGSRCRPGITRRSPTRPPTGVGGAFQSLGVAARNDEPGLEGEHQRRARSRTSACRRPADMGLHRPLGEHQPLGDLLLERPLPDQHQHLALAAVSRASRGARPPGGANGGVPSITAGRPTARAARPRRRPPARRGRAGPAKHVLEQEAGRPARSAVDVVVGVERGQHDHPRRRSLRARSTAGWPDPSSRASGRPSDDVGRQRAQAAASPSAAVPTTSMSGRAQQRRETGPHQSWSSTTTTRMLIKTLGSSGAQACSTVKLGGLRLAPKFCTADGDALCGLAADPDQGAAGRRVRARVRSCGERVVDAGDESTALDHYVRRSGSGAGRMPVYVAERLLDDPVRRRADVVANLSVVRHLPGSKLECPGRLGATRPTACRGTALLEGVGLSSDGPGSVRSTAGGRRIREERVGGAARRSRR